MIDALIRWSLHNRAFVITLSVLMMSWGIYEATRMPVDVFPDLTAPTVTVLAEAHGMAPEEVETLITFPLESTLNGSPGIRRVRSSTSVGIAIVWVEFDWGVDIYRARQIVSEKLQLARALLPPELEPPIMAPVSSVMGQVMLVAITSDSHSPMELKTTADWIVRRRLMSLSGVAHVVPIGGDTKQFQVILNPDRLSAYGIPMDQVADALRGANENTSAGFYQENGSEHLIHGLGRIEDINDIANTLVTVIDGEPILVRHLAEVKIGPALKRGNGGFNGEDAVIISIYKQPQTNTLDLTRRLDAELADIQKSLPEPMTIQTHIFRQADFIEVAVANVLEALRDGSILVILVVLLFLGSGRATAITVLAIPMSLAAAVIALKAMGGSINTMTLGGMAIAIGALVDDAIIDVENVARRMRQNNLLEQPRAILTVVFEASKEVRVSIVFATYIIVLVFIPLFALGGIEGRLLRPLGFAYIISLAASLLTALTLTPILCSLLLSRSSMLKKKHEAWAVRGLKRLYQPVLGKTIHRASFLGVVSLILVAAAGFLLSRMGQSFLPAFNEGTLTINAMTLPGTALAESDRMGRQVEQILLTVPEVISTARSTGRAEQDEHAQGVNASELEVNLRQDGRPMDVVIEDIRGKLAQVPGMVITIGQPIGHRIDHMLSGTRANIAVKIFGTDLTELRTVAKQVEAAATAVPGVVDLSVEQQMEIPFITMRFNRDAVARYGLSIRDVSHAVETAFVGQKVSRVLEGQAVFDLLVRLDEQQVGSLEAIRRTLLVTPSGARVPLEALAEIRKDLGPNAISRENGQRKIVVQCNVAGRDLSGVVNDIRDRVAREVDLPTGYFIQYGGQFENAESAARTLLILGAVAVAGIFLLLFMALHSVRDAFLVMINLPLALIGGVVGVYLSGQVISIASIIGFIALFGIATRNGILLVSHIRHLRFDEGVTDLTRAVTQAAMERLAPILMTALSAALALIPLALKAGQPGGEIEAPMAVVILCGLVSSTALNLLVVPALYLRFGARNP